MKCQILFSGKNKKNISKCHLLKILPRVLSVKQYFLCGIDNALSTVYLTVLGAKDLANSQHHTHFSF